MGTYAIVNMSTGIVENIIIWDGSEDSGYLVPDGFNAVEYSEESPAGPGYTYADGIFTPPPPTPLSPPTASEILQRNNSLRDALLISASQAMTPLLVSLQLGEATPAETKSAKEWQSYVRSLKLLDLTIENPKWPSIPS